MAPDVTFPSLSPELFLHELAASGLVVEREARRALDAGLRTGAAIERVVLELGLVREDVLFRFLADHLRLPFLEPATIDSTLWQELDLTSEYLQRVDLLPFAETDDGDLCVAMSDPRASDRLRDLGFHLRRTIVPYLAAPSTLRSALAPQAVAGETVGGVAEADIDRLRALANDGPVVRQVNHLIAEAVTAGASDIHLEAQDHGARVRIRVDGILRSFAMISEADRAAVVSRLKVMANLNISERRRPQDGRAEVAVRGRNIDIRISTLPSQFGESIVMRLLDRNRLNLDWAALGFSQSRTDEIRQILNFPSGIFLIAGPTGSGKTTTLYTALEQINSDDRKIVTVEDPIEYSLPGVVQVQVEPEIEMTFARALRSILRQDPDTIMIGEIRDQETAEIAVRAALVGRLVLSTVHTNSSIAAVTRLVDLGVPAYLLAATLRGVLSQRLVRRNCTNCSGRGCPSCSGSGRQGRLVISELLTLTTDISARIGAGQDQYALLDAARSRGFRLLSEEAMDLVDGGVVAQEEVLRALGAEID